MNPDKGEDGNNLTSFMYLPVYFDFAEMGLVNSGDFLKKVEGIRYVGTFLYESQSWRSSSIGFGGNISLPFDFSRGMLLTITPKSDIKFIQYGILSKLSFEFKNENKKESATNFSYAFFLPQSKFKKTKDFLTEFKDDIRYVSTFLYESQSWRSSSFGFGGSVSLPYDFKQLMPLFTTPEKEGNNVIWK